MMSFLNAIFLGILQGLTEFLPVSSSGHLVLAQHFLHLDTAANLTFDVMLHFGSLLAVIIYFKRDIYNLVASLFHWSSNSSRDSSNHWYVLYFIVATIVTGAIGFTFKDFFEAQFGSPYIVSCMLIVTGILIYISDLVPSSQRRIEHMGLFRAILIGLGQAVAIMPGISRSGTTISVSLFSGIRREDAARFSFLLSIPAILGASLSEYKNILNLDISQLWIYVGGVVSAFVSGYLVIALLLEIIRNKRLRYFSFYCWAVALVSMILLAKGY
jgi:undecaprenyl-diphosphatase